MFRGRRTLGRETAPNEFGLGIWEEVVGCMMEWVFVVE